MREQNSSRVAFTQKFSNPAELAGAVGILLVFLLLITAFAVFPLPGGDDWQTFYGAGQRVLHGEPLYGSKITFSYFYNPPWLALLFAPLAALPFRLGWGILTAFSILSITLLCRRWKMGTVKMIAVLLSPPMFYTILHGNIDAFLIGAVLLPREFWVIAAITKPQTTIALVAGALRANWVKTILITGGVFLLSLILFGNWPAVYLAQPIELLNTSHNVFRNLWPYNILPGLVLVFIGWKQQDEKFLIGASPFFSPYAATSTLLGPLMLLISKLKGWQALAVVAMYWAGSVLIQYL